MKHISCVALAPLGRINRRGGTGPPAADPPVVPAMVIRHPCDHSIRGTTVRECFGRNEKEALKSPMVRSLTVAGVCAPTCF